MGKDFGLTRVVRTYGPHCDTTILNLRLSKESSNDMRMQMYRPTQAIYVREWLCSGPVETVAVSQYRVRDTLYLTQYDGPMI